MAASLDIDSSDYEDVDDGRDRSLFAPNPKIGKRVSALIVANQAVDRPLSKKNARELTYAHGAPKTRDAQHSVMAIWDTYCTTINHDSTQCPSGEQIFRFIDTRVRRTIPVISGKTVPSLSFIRKVWRILIDLLTFRHEDLPHHYTPYHEKRINVHLSQLASQKLLVRGRWKKRQWIGFKVIQRMAQTWLDRALNEGCLSWDRTLLKLLGILLQAGCSSRAGDIARSSLYEGFECLCYKHLELSIKDREKPLDSVQNLTLKVTLEFMKGYKSTMNESHVVFIDPLEDASQSAVCVVKMLLIIALRFGRVRHATIEEVLAQAAGRYDGVVEWAKPEAPVLCQIARGTSTIAYDKPAHQSQVRNAVQEIALAAGILDEVNSHDIRRGALRDAAYMSQPIHGAAGRAVALIANHTVKSLDNGNTQEYVGPLQQPIWNMRAEQQFEDRLAPRFAPAPFTKSSNFSPHETDAYMDEHGMDKTDTSQRMKVGKVLKRAATDAWREEQLNARAGPVKAAPAKKTPATKKRKAQPLGQRSGSQVNADAGILAVSRQLESERSHATSDSFSAAPGSTKPTPEGDLGKTAPRPLALDDVESADVDEHELNYVCDLIDGHTTEQSNDDQAAKDSRPLDDDQCEADDEEVEQALADELQQDSAGETTPTHLTGNSFVTKFSTINVYRLKRSFDSSNPDVVAAYVPTGNSRDPPEPFLHFCSKCNYSSRWIHVLEMHEVACTVDPDSTPNETRYYCHYEGCTKSYPKESTLKTHINTAHEFVPKSCIQCPDKPDVIFNTQYELTNHRSKFHNDLDNPTVCPYQDECGKEDVYTDKKAFKLHLRSVHKKTPKEIEAIIPRKKAVRARKEFRCPMQPCKVGGVFTAATLRKHLVSGHGLTASQADIQVPLGKIEQNRRQKASKQQAEVHLDDDEDEDEDEDYLDGDSDASYGKPRRPSTKRPRTK